MKKRTVEDLEKRALEYTTRGDFQKYDFNAYQIAAKRKILDQICSHMPERVDQSGKNNPKFKWSNEKIQSEALKFKDRQTFKCESVKAYNAACSRGILDTVCAHMSMPSNSAYDDQELLEAALKYDSRSEFRAKEPSIYTISCKKGSDFLDTICSHMKRPLISFPEKTILEAIQKYYPKAKKFKATKLKSLERPFLTWLEVDIFVPELNRGIEYDGARFHSIESLKKSHPSWPEKDIEKYHEIKDEIFLALGIEILHIKEVDWKKNKEECLSLCLQFLGKPLWP